MHSIQDIVWMIYETQDGIVQILHYVLFILLGRFRDA